REGDGYFHVNVATAKGINRDKVGPVLACNPRIPADRQRLVEAVAEADEIATALPSVQFYGDGEPGSVVDILAEGLKLRVAAGSRRASVVYTAENHNHAAGILEEKLNRHLGDQAEILPGRMQFLNTVIGKMSGVVVDEQQMREQKLARLVGDTGRCLLVEAFNRILISRITLPGFRRGIEVFTEKADLLPFEEAKLYGHNATHALLGYLARLRGLRFMADIRNHAGLQQLGRDAFIEESGAALCRRHAGIDRLFTPAGYREYVDDLLERMMNPALRDAVERVVRDPRRKLGWDDRLIGTMRVALDAGINPERYALGAAAALRMLEDEEGGAAGMSLLDGLWSEAGARASETERLRVMLVDASKKLRNFVK
ncbi:MAG: hypothetical protein LC725_03105, partial [Lentisphaerae bacterium]|nr:hypothetical protein [Lentisphaerota bacterium]